VFSYGCPACFQFNAPIKKLKSHLPARAELIYVPASFRSDEYWPLFQRIFFTAQALGVTDKAHDDLFAAVWSGGPLALRDENTRKPLTPTLEAAAQLFAKYGIKPEDFLATANSFAINTQMKRADAYVKATGVDATPTLIVNGKYRITGQAAGSWDAMIQVTEYLVAQELAGK